MQSTRIRTGLAALAALSALAGPLAGSAAARPKKGGGSKGCTQSLPNGNVVEYTSGTVITVREPNGKSYKFRCANGEWVRALEVIQPVNPVAPIGPLR